MTDPKDPPRLLDPSSGTAPGLRDALSAAHADWGSDAQVARLATRLGPLLGPPAVLAPPAAATAAGLGVAAKLGLAGVALLVAGGGAWLLSAPKSAPPSAPISGSAPVTATPPSPATPDARAAIATPPVEATSPESPSASKPSAKPTPPAQLSEAELLEQARSALRGDPARALGRANEHRRRFPGGALVQEREVIAIKALRQLGRTAEADSRAAAFAKAFPGSAFQRKLQPTP